MNAPKARQTATAQAAAATAAPDALDAPEWPKLVHAYRRQPHMRHNDRTGLSEEIPVEVVFSGEKVKFRSNDAGHIVGEVHSKETYDRLVKEIPEAYIPYTGGENIPAQRVLADEHKNEEKPEGQFVLTSKDAAGKPVYKVLDDLSDDQVRAFGKECGLEADALPEVLTGETLQRALYNLLGGAAA